MKTIISIDDTDNEHSPGSGQLADDLAQELILYRLVTEASDISRHQLFVHDLVPYTSHNSAMCFTVCTDRKIIFRPNLIALCSKFSQSRISPRILSGVMCDRRAQCSWLTTSD